MAMSAQGLHIVQHCYMEFEEAAVSYIYQLSQLMQYLKHLKHLVEKCCSEFVHVRLMCT